MTVPGAWPELLGTAADWGDVTTAQADAGPVPYPRGRALGGSGAINAMAHIRGHPAVYDAWAAAEAAGWGYEDLLPYFWRSERTEGRHPVLRGTAGPVRVAPVPGPERHPVAVAFAAALVQAGCPVTDDLSGLDQEGAAWADLAIDGGQRVSPADAYLTPAQSRPNLTIRTGCLVTGLQVRHGHCTGVSYLRDGIPDLARCCGEVIVCAGAVGSPHLLLLSGIGPAAQLRALGIDVVADLPGVGENLQDHPVVLARYASPGPLPRSRYNHGEVYAAVRSPLAGAWPDLHLFPILLPATPAGCKPPPAGYALAAAVVAPASRGWVRLAAADPLAGPVINPGFLSDQRDAGRLEAGLAIIRRAAASPALAPVGAAEIAPGPGICASAAARAWIRAAVGSYWHPAGTCRIGAGADPGAVIDPELRVRGITGMRIADASVIPVIPNAPLHATVLAIAEKAADLIGSQ
jgi:choline dehydrogenase